MDMFINIAVLLTKMIAQQKADGTHLLMEKVKHFKGM